MAQELSDRRRPSGRRRVAEAAACGAIAGLVSAWFLPWELTLLVAWDVAAVVVLLRVWLHLRHYDAAETRKYATREDDDPHAAELMLVVAGSTSLLGVAFAFIAANTADDVMSVVLRVAGILTIALSWGVIHTVFALRYARLYYSPPGGGINFHSDQDPDYVDFAYLALTIGMTYQVSDTDIGRRVLRRTALKHAMLSFFFGTVILATTVNLVADLLNG